MAKLKASPHFILNTLFPGKDDLRLAGVSYDAERDLIVFDIEGRDVPDCEEVVAIITERVRTIEFKPLDV